MSTVRMKKTEKYKMLWYCTYHIGQPVYWIGTYKDKPICGILDKAETMLKPNTYKVYSITKKAMDNAAKAHLQFQKDIGYHCDTDPKVYQPYVYKGRELLDMYYDDPKREKMDYTSPPSGSTYLDKVKGPDITWYPLKYDRTLSGKRARQ